MSHIDEVKELQKYQIEVLSKARASGMSDEDIAYIEEDLRSQKPREIAFALNMSAKQVDNHLFRTKLKLREAVTN